MTLKEAEKIIEIIPHNTHKYTLMCNFCHKRKLANTDSPIELLIRMAEEHKGCMVKRKEGQ